MKKAIFVLSLALTLLVAGCNKDNLKTLELEGTTWRADASFLYSSGRDYVLTFSADDNTVTWQNASKPIKGTYTYSENNKEVIFSGLQDEFTLSKGYRSKSGGLVVDVIVNTSMTHIVFEKE